METKLLVNPAKLLQIKQKSLSAGYRSAIWVLINQKLFCFAELDRIIVKWP